MGLLGTLGNIAKAPGSLLWSGLKGAGRNFNRNAMGGLDEIMGADLTPGMRSVLRAERRRNAAAQGPCTQQRRRGFAAGEGGVVAAARHFGFCSHVRSGACIGNS